MCQLGHKMAPRSLAGRWASFSCAIELCIRFMSFRSSQTQAEVGKAVSNVCEIPNNDQNRLSLFKKLQPAGSGDKRKADLPIAMDKRNPRTLLLAAEQTWRNSINFG